MRIEGFKSAAYALAAIIFLIFLWQSDILPTPPQTRTVAVYNIANRKPVFGARLLSKNADGTSTFLGATNRLGQLEIDTGVDFSTLAFSQPEYVLVEIPPDFDVTNTVDHALFVKLVPQQSED